MLVLVEDTTEAIASSNVQAAQPVRLDGPYRQHHQGRRQPLRVAPRRDAVDPCHDVGVRTDVTTREPPHLDEGGSDDTVRLSKIQQPGPKADPQSTATRPNNSANAS